MIIHGNSNTKIFLKKVILNFNILKPFLIRMVCNKQKLALLMVVIILLNNIQLSPLIKQSVCVMQCRGFPTSI